MLSKLLKLIPGWLLVAMLNLISAELLRRRGIIRESYEWYEGDRN
jgi:hypothetical protein